VTGAAAARHQWAGGSTTLGGLVGNKQGLISDSSASETSGVPTSRICRPRLVGDNSGTILSSTPPQRAGGSGSNAAFGRIQFVVPTISTAPAAWNADGSAVFQHRSHRRRARKPATSASHRNVAGGFAGGGDGIIASISKRRVTGGGNSILGGFIGALTHASPGLIIASTSSGPVTSTGPNSIVAASSVSTQQRSCSRARRARSPARAKAISAVCRSESRDDRVLVDHGIGHRHRQSRHHRRLRRRELTAPSTPLRGRQRDGSHQQRRRRLRRRQCQFINFPPIRFRARASRSAHHQFERQGTRAAAKAHGRSVHRAQRSEFRVQPPSFSSIIAGCTDPTVRFLNTGQLPRRFAASAASTASAAAGNRCRPCQRRFRRFLGEVVASQTSAQQFSSTSRRQWPGAARRAQHRARVQHSPGGGAPRPAAAYSRTPAPGARTLPPGFDPTHHRHSAADRDEPHQGRGGLCTSPPPPSRWSGCGLPWRRGFGDRGLKNIAITGSTAVRYASRTVEPSRTSFGRWRQSNSSRIAQPQYVTRRSSNRGNRAHLRAATPAEGDAAQYIWKAQDLRTSPHGQGHQCHRSRSSIRKSTRGAS